MTINCNLRPNHASDQKVKKTDPHFFHKRGVCFLQLFDPKIGILEMFSNIMVAKFQVKVPFEHKKVYKTKNLICPEEFGLLDLILS